MSAAYADVQRPQALDIAPYSSRVALFLLFLKDDSRV
jgi:hypothetical protein